MQHDRNYVRWMVLYIYICAHHLHMGNSHMYICTCNCTHEIRLHHHACTCRHAQNKTVYHVCVLYNKISYANTSNFCWILGRKGAKRGNDAKQKMVKPKSSSRIGFTNYSCSQCSPGTPQQSRAASSALAVEVLLQELIQRLLGQGRQQQELCQAQASLLKVAALAPEELLRSLML